MSRISRIVIIVLCGLTVGVVAAILDADALYFLSAFILVVPLGSFVFGLIMLRHISVRVVTPSPVVAGAPAPIVIQLLNDGSLPRFNIGAVPELPPNAGLGLRRRKVRRDAAPPILSRTPEADEGREFAPYISPGRLAEVVAIIKTQRRGIFPISDVVLRHMDILKLSNVRRRVRAEGSLVVYPQPLNIALPALTEGDLIGAERTTRRRGGMQGGDFYGVRSYSPGDDWRRVHWPTTARMGSLMVMEREAPSSLSVLIIIDYAAAPGDTADAPLERLICLAARIAQDSLRRMSAVGLAALLPDGQVAPLLDAGLDVGDVLKALSAADPRSTTAVRNSVVHEMRGTTAVILAERWDARVAQAARARDGGVVIVLDASETADPPPIVGGVLRVEDGAESAAAPDRAARPVSSAYLPVWRLVQTAGSYHVEPLARL